MRARTWLLTGALVMATAVLGLPAAANAAPAKGGAATPAGTASAKQNVVAVCGTPKKGQSACFALRRTDLAPTRGLRPADATPQGYGPSDLRSAYTLPANGGAGATIAIVDAFDDPNAESDLAVYRQQFGLPACDAASGCFRKVDQRGGTDYPTPNGDWSGEISLDLDMVSAIAPQAHIVLVEADTNNNTDLYAAEDEAVATGAKYVSNSWGSGYDSTPGSGEDPTETTASDPYFNHPGVAIVASTGDLGYGVAYPAASQYVTSVGGTALTRADNTRGWSESVWNNSFGAPGSGCSLYEPKPSFQTDTGCANRAEADVSAVADPATGVAVYQTYGNTGWSVYGGTSAAAPIITSTFADAGTPVAGTYPNSYPYAATGALNDVTTGNNGTCSPAYLCTAGPGYDGPTGLGTPNGTGAFSTGPHGEVTGTVTDAGTGAGIAGATVAAGDTTTTTDAQGHYDLHLPVGSYDVTANGYGYSDATVTGVAVADGAQVTEDFSLTAVPHATVSGTVTDGSGHGWPLYAKVTADGVPGGGVFTDPSTGHYSMDLPQGQTYQLKATPVYTGYETGGTSVTLGTTDAQANMDVPVDALACDAPGYQLHYAGTTQSFDATTAPDGWTVDNGTGTAGWVFTDDGNRGNLTGGSGGFAMVDSDHDGSSKTENTTLTAPAADFTGVSSPTVSFDTDYNSFNGQTADVDVSVDGGTTWSNVWHHGSDALREAHVDIPLPQAAGKSSVLIRFHFTGSFGWWWELDNVFVGARTCDPTTPGGIVFGQVTDANTGKGLVGAKVTSVDQAGVGGTTAATPDDTNLGDGFYWLFSPATGTHQFTATDGRYTTATGTVKVSANYATRADFALKAGQVTVSPSSIAKTVAWGGTASATVTLKNTGTEPATVNLGEQSGASTLMTAGGAPVQKVNGSYSPHALRADGKSLAPAAKAAPADGTPSDAPWTAIADYPTPIQDNVAAVNDGKLYSAFGFTGDGDTSAMYVYDPDSGAWSPLASAADTREKPAAAFINGKFYAAGGWDANGNADPKLEIYDPATNGWSTGAPDPKPYAGSGTAVLDGKLYVVGGCTSTCGSTDVEVYDPVSDTWSPAAAYPEQVSWESCGALGAKVYCAGGTTNSGAGSSHAYAYDPGTDSWSPVAGLPMDLWGSDYTAANGMLLVSGGVTNNSATVTNQGFAYDPSSDSWTALPNANNALYRGGSACGFYQIGGNPGGAFAPPLPIDSVLPGFADCGGASDVPWLSESTTSVTLAPGKSAKVTVTVNAADASITQPGTYTANVAVSTDTPYSTAGVAVSMTVNPPKTWGKITGSVTSAADGSTLAGATVQIDSWATSYTLKTDKNGQYALWLDTRNNPLQVIVAKDGYQPQVGTVKITKGATTTASFALKKD
ncbi:carboxypeptidase regulatory-like domain-containing protein [Rugosimonospora acidiphila]|uniref:carboxypeptidase regulatory-like domain-containing protein n=1 Tax=Rugosimonospora acidiphila TaxID=556531 RepID=UPI0031EE0758